MREDGEPVGSVQSLGLRAGTCLGGSYHHIQVVLMCSVL